MEFTLKLRPVSVKSTEDSSSSGVASSDSLFTELSRLLSGETVDHEVVIDWIDVSRSSLSLAAVWSSCELRVL